MWGTRALREQLREMEERLSQPLRAISQQQAAIDEMSRRLAVLEEQVTRAREEEQAASPREAAAVDFAASVEAMNRLSGAVKRFTQREKRAVQTTSTHMKRVVSHLSRLAIPFDPSLDPAFAEVVQPLVASRRTMLGYDRLFTLWQAAVNVASLQGAAAEIGTFRGGSAALLAQALRSVAGRDPDLHVVDTFAGHLDATFTEHDPEQQRGKFSRVSYEDVRMYLSTFPGVTVHQGNAATVLGTWPERPYILAHLDVDLYQPILDCLNYFGPRLVPGGVIVIDDYEAATCPGVSLAAHEFLERSRGFQLWRLQPEQAVLIKRP